MAAAMGTGGPGGIEGDPLWYKDAVIYELHVRAFHDSDADGIGDFQGLTEKLDYLQDLGVTALWLLPFYPSPLRDDGYDIADYRGIHSAYGSMRDFKRFLREAHRRGLRVITELVINHTSDEHAWFQRARRAGPGTRQRDFYVWTEDPSRYAETRIIFKDFEPSNWTWDSEAGAYFWHRFYHHQPDLNFDNPAVHRELLRVLDFWLEMGVDGMRLDAIPYLYEREGTNCENLPETHAFLKQLRAHVDERFEGRMLLAEANQWPEDAAAYFGDGDECHMNFHFPIMPRLFMALRMEDRFPIVDILEETPPIPELAQWAMFLRNHDELTLEMVTDEERDYMYRVYAHDERARINLGIRRRLAPLLQNNRRKIELLNSLLFALPGTPVLYYGDEIGMGDNFYLGDRNGVRTPMQWSGDRNAGFSRANPQRLYLPVVIDPEYHYESVNVEAQEGNPSSLLWWMRRMIGLRKQYQAFGRGTLEWVNPENKRVLAFVREHGDETLLVVANLSRFAQAARLDLAGYAGRTPVELLGRNPFPPIEEDPYALTLGPHGFFWFSLAERVERDALEVSASPGRQPGAAPVEREPPLLVLSGDRSWEGAFRGRARARLEAALLEWMRGRRWFAGKGREVRSVALTESVPLPHDGKGAALALVEVDYIEEDAETYAIPLAFARGQEAEELAEERPGLVVCRLRVAGVEGVIFDALARPALARALLKTIAHQREHAGEHGSVAGVNERGVRAIRKGGDDALEPRIGGAEQSNTSVLYGDRWVLKLFRRLEEGMALDREMGRALDLAGFEHTPGVAGALEYRRGRRPPITLGVLQDFVPNEGDAWSFTLEALDRFLERAAAAEVVPEDLPPPPLGLGAAARAVVPDAAHERVGVYLESARLLGIRTGELHLALGTPERGEAFRPEPFTTLYQRSLYQSLRNLTGHTFRLLGQRRKSLAADVADDIESVRARREDVLAAFRAVRERKIDGQRIRVHGDYHLGQVLYTGKDFVIIDFEGEPARPLSERRLKRSPLRDVAGMLRSFHYAGYAALARHAERGLTPSVERAPLEDWIRFWIGWTSAAFVAGYFEAVDDSPLLPSGDDDRELLLRVFLLEKALYELRYEIENRPDWVRIPVAGVLQLVEGA
ncbi:MAG TPA: maltose alpha-D-glucosyltransferase [Gemmatimonadota bacterium]|nr:maltose alpha-D-glucosyltransferase [Gemmatimonadota bacterium]